MSKTCTIEKVELKIAGKTISLAIEEAKELRDILSEAFPKPSQPAQVIVNPPYAWPWHYWRQPKPVWREDNTNTVMQLSCNR